MLRSLTRFTVLFATVALSTAVARAEEHSPAETAGN